MEQSTYDPCLLYTDKDTGFSIIGLQTDDTLFLGDDVFAEAEEAKLHEAGFLAKKREKLTLTTPLKFNGSQINCDNDTITLTQEH